MTTLTFALRDILFAVCLAAVIFLLGLFNWLLYDSSTYPYSKKRMRKKKVKPKKLIGKLNIGFISKGVINYKEISMYDTNFKHKYGKTTYQVTQDNLVIPRRFRLWRWFDRLIGVPGRYEIYFRDGDADAIGLDVDRAKEPVTPQTLYIAQKSTILGEALKGLFASHINPRHIIFAVVVIGVAVLVWMVMTKQIDLNRFGIRMMLQ